MASLLTVAVSGMSNIQQRLITAGGGRLPAVVNQTLRPVRTVTKSLGIGQSRRARAPGIPTDYVNIITVGDSKVCRFCSDYAARGPYPRATARAAIPHHPGCRCVTVALSVNLAAAREFARNLTIKELGDERHLEAITRRARTQAVRATKTASREELQDRPERIDGPRAR